MSEARIKTHLEEPFTPDTIVGFMEATIGEQIHTIEMSIADLVDYAVRSSADTLEMQGHEVVEVRGLRGLVRPTQREVRWSL